MKKMVMGMEVEFREPKKAPILMRVKPGVIVELSDCNYRVEANGQWTKIHKAPLIK